MPGPETARLLPVESAACRCRPGDAESRDGRLADWYLTKSVRASDSIYSGSEPAGDAAFAALARLGVKTIVSVDGARPDVDAAHKAGLRYIHIPIGYDGIPEPAAAALTRAGRDAEKPIYVHCHHGRHRGPAAAAIACIGIGETRGNDAPAILGLAGTGKEYAGLWRDVEAFMGRRLAVNCWTWSRSPRSVR